jgi:hypothetical protein
MNQIVLPGTEMLAELSIDLSMAQDDADIDQRALMELLAPLEQHLTVLIEFANHSKAARHEHLPLTIGFFALVESVADQVVPRGHCHRTERATKKRSKYSIVR